ncbi:MAG: TadE family protein [Candidatus Villigracilaceae bacterium]
MRRIALRNEHGQSLVEFAISLTVILLLLAGAVDFGMAFFSFIALRDAAQEGALYGSMSPTDTNGIIARVRGASNRPVDLSNTSTVQVTPQIIGQPCEGGGIQVTVVYSYPISMPFLSAILGQNTIPIRASVTDTILQPTCP